MKPLNRNIKRISRTYYWAAWAIWNSVCAGIAFLMAMEYQNHDPVKMRAGFAVLFGIHITYLVLLTIKRFHDAGKSTEYCIMCMILMLFFIGNVLIFLVAVKESDGDNEWGTNEEKREYERNRQVYGK